MPGIDVVNPGRDELQWLDITIRRSTVVVNVDSVNIRWLLCPTRREIENEKIRDQERDRSGHGEADQLRTGRQTRVADDNCAPRIDKETGRSPWRRAQLGGSPKKAEADLRARMLSMPRLVTRSRQF